jgi:HSP20 family protein
MVFDLDFNTLFPERMHRLFEEVFKPEFFAQRRLAYPPLNLSEDASTVFVRCEIPGVEMKDIELTLTDKSLIVKGERATEKGKYFRQERPAGLFQRIVSLNVPVDRERVKATLVDGILTVVLPKAEECLPKKISIDIA